ncbi:MAG: chromate resistance protein [Verrucomicrobia bacterium]|nr:chromate resistance protein [Verrucomicrobiota bacterium]
MNVSLSTMRLSASWLLLLYGLPTGQTAGRVSLWRKLKKFGALQLKTSAYVLPNTPVHAERFQWLAKQVRDDGGEATLIRVTEIEGLTDADLARLFNDARARDYAEHMKAVGGFIRRQQRRRTDSYTADLEKLAHRFNEIRAIDYFHCPNAHDAEMLLQRAEGLVKPRGRQAPKLARREFAGRTWLTRPRPEIDRVGSAWLIRRCIDTRARFVFAASPAEHPAAIPYDMFDVEFTHQGDDCTFETLLKRFDIQDAAARRIGEMIHDADLEDGKFGRREGFGLDRLFKGWARLGWTDEKILARGFECFEALYAEGQRRGRAGVDS